MKHALEAIALIAMLLLSSVTRASPLVSVSAESAEIRVGASAKSELIGTAKKSTVMEARGEQSGWTKVVMPSGEYRYVLSTSVKPIAQAPAFVAPKDVRSFCTELLQAERTATDEVANVKDMIKQIDMGRIRSDRYKLQLLAKYDLQPVHNTTASVMCAQH